MQVITERREAGTLGEAVEAGVSMPYSIRSTDLGYMNEAERIFALTALVQAALQNNGESKAITNAQIRQFELRYEMISDEMRRKLAEGQIKETAEIVEWLFLLRTLEYAH